VLRASAIATFSVTTRPKSRRSGSGDTTSVAKPPIVVAADTKNARPVRDAAVWLASSIGRPGLTFLEVPAHDQHGELGAGGDDERARHRGERAELDAEQADDQRRCTHAEEHRHEREERSAEAPEPEQQEQAGEAQREVREGGTVGGEVLEQADADRGEPGGCGTHRLLAGREVDEEDAVGREVECVDALLEVGLELADEDGPVLQAGGREPQVDLADVGIAPGPR
jgi:hypothetical protein